MRVEVGAQRVELRRGELRGEALVRPERAVEALLELDVPREPPAADDEEQPRHEHLARLPHRVDPVDVHRPREAPVEGDQPREERGRYREGEEGADELLPAAAVHGIDAAALSGAPTFAEVAPRLAAMLDGAVPVMHGVELDVCFLDRAFAAAGSPRRVGPALDTLRLARRALHSRQYNLTSLCTSLGFAPVRWHRAAEDVKALHPLFNRLCAALDPVDAMDLWQVRAGIERALAAAAGSPKPIRLIVRTPGHAEREMRVRVLWFRSPHVGLAAAGQGVVPAILRADRVLRVPG